ncbi:MFS transporter [Streptomyces sp. NPDC048603]|uniref:MFS transporter n=1 Tax=Streptomyces sp. NPDC048603 TaxID=3365577 RepID=UPI00371CDEF0
MRSEWTAMPSGGTGAGAGTCTRTVRLPGHRRRLATAAVAFAFWTTMVGTTVPTPLYPLYERAFGFSSSAATVVFAVYAGGVVVGLLVLGRLADQVGRRPVLAAALLLSVAAAALFLLAQGLTALLAGRVLSGLSAALITAAATAGLTELAPAARRARAGILALAANMGGLACGTLLGGITAQYAPAPLRILWGAQGALAVIALIGLVAVPETVTPTGRVSLGVQRLRVPAAARGPFLRSALVSGSGFAVLGVFASVSALFLAELGVSNLAASGLMVGLAFLGTAAGQLLVGALGTRNALPAACCGLVVAATLIATALLGRLLVPLIAASVLTGLATGAAVGDGVTGIAASVAPERRGEAYSAFFVILYAMLAAPAVGVGALAAAYGPTAAGTVFSAAVAALAAAVLAALVRARARAPEGA